MNDDAQHYLLWHQQNGASGPSLQRHFVKPQVAPQNKGNWIQENLNTLGAVGGGLAGGAAGGALAGTALLPGVGTVAGGVIGGLLGSFAGGAGGEAAKRASKGQEQSWQESGKQGVIGAAGELAGQGIGLGAAKLLGKIVPKGVEAGAEVVAKSARSKTAERLMASLLKQPAKEGQAAVKGGTSLAREALDRGFVFNTSEGGYKTALGKMAELEGQLQGALAKSKATVPLAEIQKAVNPLMKKYAQAGNTSAVNALSERLLALEGEHAGGKIPVAVANEVKRTIYNEVRGGYGTLASENKEGLKTMARAIKDSIAKQVDGADALNKDLSFFGRVSDSLEKTLAKQGKASLIGLPDLVAGGAGAAAFGPAGLLAVGARHAAQSPAVVSRLAQTIDDGGKVVGGLISKLTGGAAKAVGPVAARTVPREVGSMMTAPAQAAAPADPSMDPSLDPTAASSTDPTMSSADGSGIDINAMLQDALSAPDAKTQGAKLALIKDVLAIQQSALPPKKKPLSSEATKQVVNAKSGLKAISQLESIMQADPGVTTKNQVGGLLGNIGRGLAGTQEFEAAKNEIVDVISRSRSGAALTKAEIDNYKAALPSFGDSPTVAKQKLQRFRQLFSGTLDQLQNGSPDTETDLESLMQ